MTVKLNTYNIIYTCRLLYNIQWCMIPQRCCQRNPETPEETQRSQETQCEDLMSHKIQKPQETQIPQETQKAQERSRDFKGPRKPKRNPETQRDQEIQTPRETKRDPKTPGTSHHSPLSYYII
ncbi:hypothetical protein Pmani_020703 [Petrolisthes manimaculis]|uniref:Uncharacterized protein n=1 Tax=Petrolisthes manimaculis TaxID=1843537 RepID=A0AAE1PHU5_9EUCA|nr:hypothetical protein Pmani_020703 [Petrolisthes manimaculis]